jgi:S1-C subfamily serine protease
VLLGDVIVGVGTRTVTDLSSTLNAIADVPPGKTVPVTVLRKNQEVALSVTFGRRKPRTAEEE